MTKLWVVAIQFGFDLMKLIKIGAGSAEEALYNAMLEVTDKDNKDSQKEWNDDMRKRELNVEGILSELADGDISAGVIEI